MTVDQEREAFDEKRKQARISERRERHRTVSVLVDTVLDAVAEQVNQVAGMEPRPARDRLLVVVGGFMGDDDDKDEALALIAAALDAIAERTHPEPSEKRPARDAAVKLLQAHDDEIENVPEAERVFPAA